MIAIHGYARRVNRRQDKTYITWCAMKRRCLSKTATQYGHYGGRGIAVCDRWLSFGNFLFDMGDKPNGMTLERNDTNGNYEPSNCRWATRKEQCNNRRNNVVATFNGKTQTITAWAYEFGLEDGRPIFCRIYKGWTMERALSTPFRK